MKSKLVWLAIGGMMLAGCGTAATSPTMTTAPQNNYQVMGGTPTPAPAPVQQPVQQPMPVPVAPCIDCGSYAPWAAVERDYGFNVGYGIPFGYQDVLYDASPWARGFGLYGMPCATCGPVVPPVLPQMPVKPGKDHGGDMPGGAPGGDMPGGDGGEGGDGGGETTTNY